MNEELKIIIKAVTSDAKKSIQDIKKELNGVSGSAQKSSSGFGAAMKGYAKAAGIAIAAIVAVGAAIVALGKRSIEFQQAQAKLNTAFQSVGSTAQQAAESYKGLFRFLGDSDKSVEAASHLAKLTTNQKDLAEWTKACQGIYATFGDSLPIEGLTEAANESARVGKVTGTLADALNWAGVSEDDFNAKLAQTTSFEEREALIRSTLNGLYGDAAEIYEKNNKALLDYNESQANLQSSMAAAGASVTPLLTALNNLGAALFNALKPALDVIIPAIATFVNWITQGIQAVMGLFGAITGASTSINSFANVGNGLTGAATGADNLASGLDGAAKAAEKAKRATMGFDELNVVSNNSSSSGGSGSSSPAYMAPNVGAANFTTEVDQTENKANSLAETMKKIAAELKDVFAPTITAWTGAFETIKEAWNNSKENFLAGGIAIKNSFVDLGSYVVKTFVPDIVNSFSTNIAPIIGDVFGFALEEAGKSFRVLGETIEDATNELVIPALEVLKGIWMDIFDSWGSAWERNGQPLLTKLEEALDHVRSTFVKIYEQFFKPTVQKITSTIEDAWNSSLKPAYDKVVNAVMEIGQCLLDLYNKFIAPIVDWIVQKILPIIQRVINVIIEYVGNLLKDIGTVIGGIVDFIKGLIQFITGVFTGDWAKAWEGIKNIFSGVWDVIKGIAQAAWDTIKAIFHPDVIKAFFQLCWEVIKGVFSGVANWFSNLFTSAWNGIKNAWSSVKTWFSGVLKNIKDVFSPISDWFKDTFTKAWTNVKNVFSTGGKIFDGIKDGILNGLKKIVNGIIDGINKVIKVPFNGINSALSSIRGVSIAGLKPFSWLPSISVPQIPKLARGGIVDEATLALIGERGKEAVVPLENNTEWIDKLVDKLTNRQEAPSKIVLMLDGKELGWANINSINNITRQTGALQLVMG